MQRRLFARVAGSTLLVAGAARWVAAASGGATRRIPIALAKFRFSPAQIHIKQGEQVTLVLTSVDFVHGFAVPDLKLRTDVPPGKTVELALPAQRPGRYACLCDNFCGEGHDTMFGTLVVSAS